MPRVTTVKAAKKDQGACGKCRNPLPPGSAYRWWKFRYGGRRVRCMKPQCAPRPSDLTSSDKLSGLYAAQESIQDLIQALGSEPTYEEVQSFGTDVESLAEDIRSIGEEYRESAQNIEDGFGHSTYQSEELEEKADEVEQWADTISEAATDCENADQDMDEDELQDLVDAVDNASGECPL